jgi:hypothetical protein
MIGKMTARQIAAYSAALDGPEGKVQAYRYTLTMTNNAGETVTQTRTACDEGEAIRSRERCGFRNVTVVARRAF